MCYCLKLTVELTSWIGCFAYAGDLRAIVVPSFRYSFIESRALIFRHNRKAESVITTAAQN